MASLTIPVERISEEASHLQPRRFFLMLLMFPFLALGWTARGIWTLCALAYAAVKVGWQIGPTGPKGSPGRGGR